jgi:hypothetical protein
MKFGFRSKSTVHVDPLPAPAMTPSVEQYEDQWITILNTDETPLHGHTPPTVAELSDAFRAAQRRLAESCTFTTGDV